MGRARHSLTTRGSAFLSAGMVLVAGGLLLGLGDLTRIGALLLAVLALAVIFAWRHHPELEVTHSSAPARVWVDGRARVKVQVSNVGRRRSPVARAQEQLDHTLGDNQRFLLPALSTGRRHELHYVVRPRARGLHDLGPLTVEIRDPFGLTTRPATFPGTGQLLVLPPIHDLTSGDRLGRALGGDSGIPQRIALHGEDDQVVREYRDGDDLRRIHWPATARTGNLMVRQEDRPAKPRAVLLLDTRAQAHLGTGGSSSFEWAVSMTASIAAHLARSEHDVHLLVSDPHSDSGARLVTGLDHILLTLAMAEPERLSSLVSLWHAAHDLAAAGGLIIALVGGMDEESTRALASLRQHGSTGIAFVLTPAASASGLRVHERQPARDREHRALGTLAALEAAGWRGQAIRGTTPPPAAAWSEVTRSLDRAGS